MKIGVRYYNEDGDEIEIIIEGNNYMEVMEQVRDGDEILGLILVLEYEDTGEVEYPNQTLLN